jgi:hypothetical protein
MSNTGISDSANIRKDINYESFKNDLPNWNKFLTAYYALYNQDMSKKCVNIASNTAGGITSSASYLDCRIINPQSTATPVIDVNANAPIQSFSQPGQQFPYFNINYIGYIDDGYTLDANGMCSGNLITQTFMINVGYKDITTPVKLLAFDNLPSYKINSPNNRQQILVLTKDNKYMFPFGDGTYSSDINKVCFTTIVSIIYTTSKYNITIPLYSNVSVLFKAAQNPKYIPLNIDGSPFDFNQNQISQDANTLVRMKFLGDAPGNDPAKSLDISKTQIWTDISNLMNVYYSYYTKDLSRQCVNISTTTISSVTGDIVKYDCRNVTPDTFSQAPNDQASTDQAPTDEAPSDQAPSDQPSASPNQAGLPFDQGTMIGIGVGVGIFFLLIIGGVIIFFMMSKKNKK